MAKLNTEDFFSTINKGYPDNQMIRFIVSDKNFLIPDLYNTFKGKEFFVKSTKEDLKIFSEKCLSKTRFSFFFLLNSDEPSTSQFNDAMKNGYYLNDGRGTWQGVICE